MLFERIESEGLAHYSYLIGYGKDAFVIDPRRDCGVYVDTASSSNMRIRFIFETHRNEDYVIGSRELAAVTGAEIWHADGQWEYEYGKPVADGQEWNIGGLKLHAMMTPGHTPGMMSYLLHDDGGSPWVLFSGDALFAGDVGRVDFLGPGRLQEAAGMLYDSLFHKILPLGDSVILCPAHGSGSVCASSISERVWTTIGLERQNNPKLRNINRTDFIRDVAKDLEKPPYFQEMERVNMRGAPLLKILPLPVPLDPGAFSDQMTEAVVVDTRMPEGFATAHIPGATSIWTDGLPGFAGWFLPYGKPLLLVTEKGEEERVVRYLIRLGFDNIRGRLAGGMHAWHTSGHESISSGTVTVQRICSILDEQQPALLLDVRSEGELEKDGVIANALHIHLTQLPKRFGDLPRAMPIYVFCGSGLRSTTAASLLQQEGFEDIYVVLGGFSGWTSITCPLSVSSGN